VTSCSSKKNALLLSAISVYIVKMIQNSISYINNLLQTKPFVFLLLSVLIFLLFLIQTIRLHKKHNLIRADAIKRSRSVIGGQVAEQIAPFLPEFPCNAADARFVGKPVDFIAFPGLSEDGIIKEILLIEVKTGKSLLNGHEKEVRRAVSEGRVRYVEYHAGE